MTLGFRILEGVRRAPVALVQRFHGVPTANISDVMSRLNGGGARLRPLHAAGPMAGAALTVRTRPGDNLLVHKAINMAEPGDVIVVDAEGDLSNAIIGEIMITHAQTRGVTGFVINGAVRDFDFIEAGSFPVFAAGVTHRGPYKNGPGEINFPIALDGMSISPGDIVVGDGDGVVCIGQVDGEAVLAAALAKAETERKQMAAIEAGAVDRTWVDVELDKLGCERLSGQVK